MVRLSLPQESSRSLSWGHQDKDSTPCSCARSVRSGALEFRRSHTKIRGSWSFGIAVINLVGKSGSHTTALTAFLPKLFKVRLSFFALTSHTVTNPPLLPVTRM